MKVSVLGAGAWGTALALLLQRGGCQVTLWGHDAAQLRKVAASGRNERYLPGIDLPSNWRFESDLAAAVQDAAMIVVAVPSKAFREVTRALQNFSGIAISVTKGIEHQSGLTMCGVLAENAPQARLAALSGPSLALEVARGIPTAIVAASADIEVANAVQKVFHSPAFRVYTSTDLVGVELGGALKNVIAIAAGVCDGLGFGDNSKASLVTRGIVEMRRLGVTCGAQPETFAGLSGIGDLMVTCFSKLSRNRGFGERVGRGEKPEGILSSVSSVAEGFPTARSASELARRYQISTPIIDEVYAMLHEGKDVRQAVQDLTTRESKAED